MPGSRRYQLSRVRILFPLFHWQDFLPIGPIPILNVQRNRCPDGFPVADSRKNLCRILFDLLPPAAPITKLPPP